MIEWYLKVVRDNYANFNGRARRSEYWYFTLASLIITIILGIIDYMLGSALGLVRGVYSLAVLVPTLAVAVRRLHDIAKSGWYICVVFIPIAGAIWLLVMLCTEGTVGPNEYGPDPKRPYDEFNDIGKPEIF